MVHRKGEKFHGRSRLTFYERGPGPAGYALPPLVGKPKHALTHRINPEYSIGQKLKSAFGGPGFGPGAGAYAIRYGLKAKGYDAGFKYTMRQKFPEKPASITPGPAAYYPKIMIKPKAPEYTMRIRHRDLSRMHTPAPNLYKLGPMLGPKIVNKIAAAECTLKGVRGKEERPKTPGPSYDIGRPELVKRRAPGFTMRIKWPEISSQRTKAGPGDYWIERARIYDERPEWSFGIKHNDFTGIFKTECDKLRYNTLDLQ